MRWQPYLTNASVASITSASIKLDAEHYGEWFKDLDNPTDEEVANYFRHFFSGMSDEWEIPINGNFRIDKFEGELDDLPKGTVVQEGKEEMKRLDVNKIQVIIDGEIYILEAAAPIRAKRVDAEQEETETKPLKQKAMEPPYE
jgi:hypothetical protein